MTPRNRTPGRGASVARGVARGLADPRAYEHVFRASPLACLVTSIEGVVVDANHGAQRLLGGTREQLIGQALDRIADLGPDEVRRRLDRHDPGVATAFTATGRRLDGTTFPAGADVSVVEIEGDQYLVVHLRDLTEATRIQGELVQAQKMDAIAVLVSGVSHELNNPLAAIVAFSDLIRRDERLPEELRADAEMLVAEAGRTRRIVSNLLDFARQRPPERHPTALGALVGSVVELQSYALKDGLIAIEVDLDADLPAVELDRSQVQLALMNLVQNAVQALRASGGSGRVRITGRPIPDAGPARVRIAVEDDGPGVPVEHRDRLFVPFFTTREQGEGTGLGLPVSFGIVAAHGGNLWFEEPETGRGARFVIELPVQATGPQPGREEQPTTATRVEPTAGKDDRPEPRRVLVLDDEPAIRTFLRRALQIQGIEAVAAASGAEALELARSTRFDAMLCDHRMAGMTGPAVYEALERDQPELARHFVFMTGDVLNAELREFASSRGISLLAKPFDLATVAEAVRGVLERP
ncbi:MAG TPA: ATP-binding protein [Candidatus Limnocylindrales bacterium]|nr:ATP-binding protein [Candidatus Limnocylindrales bacterium]